ncbi:ubiquitin-like protein ATG12 isoform X2 [Paramacrobiotus metropolitanus]|nr:ubiquitin-like protein ATG12 isoform X2 [Paramacrobiotus metropolitanus]
MDETASTGPAASELPASPTQNETIASAPVVEAPSETDVQEVGGGGDVRDPVEKEKIDVLLKAVGDAPIMKKKRWAVDRTKKVIWVADFIRKFIKCEPNESLFLYVNQCFSPCPDQEIGSLYECFGSDGKLVLHYCKQQAWG